MDMSCKGQPKNQKGTVGNDPNKADLRRRPDYAREELARQKQESEHGDATKKGQREDPLTQ